MFDYSSIQGYHNALLGNATTCEEVVAFYLARIQSQQQLNAFVTVFAEEALEKARQLDKQRLNGSPMGKLHGVVVGIKDVISYKGHTLTASSHILQGFTSTYHATAVQKLLDEEAIIIGSLNCDEFAMGSSNENSFYGKTLNALDEERVPGGSSGGSAVAVQAGLCMVSLGTDTGGSVRQPADFCGILGMKPTYGRISRYGIIAYASSFDQVGIFGTNVPDIARVLEVISGPDDYDSTVSSHPVEDYSSGLSDSSKALRIGYFKDALQHEGLDQDMSASISAYIQQLPEKGYSVESIDVTFLDYIVPAYYVLTTAEASSNLSRYDGVKYGYRSKDKNLELTEFYRQTRSEGFGKEVKRRIMLGSFVLSAGYYDAYFTQAQRVRQQLHKKTQELFKKFDVIILPTVPAPAFKFGEKSADPVEMYLADIYTVYANLVGIPAISIPLFKHPNGMPFGLQAMTNQFCELSLLQFAHHLMQSKTVTV